MTDPIPEQVYLTAARAVAGHWSHLTPEQASLLAADLVTNPAHRVAVESAYRAACLATAREIADAANRPGSVPAASWRAAMDIIDELGGDPR